MRRGRPDIASRHGPQHVEQDAVSEIVGRQSDGQLEGRSVALDRRPRPIEGLDHGLVLGMHEGCEFSDVVGESRFCQETQQDPTDTPSLVGVHHHDRRLGAVRRIEVAEVAGDSDAATALRIYRHPGGAVAMVDRQKMIEFTIGEVIDRSQEPKESGGGSGLFESGHHRFPIVGPQGPDHDAASIAQGHLGGAGLEVRFVHPTILAGTRPGVRSLQPAVSEEDPLQPDVVTPPPVPKAQPVFGRVVPAVAGALAVGVAVDALAFRRPPGLGATLAMLIGLGVMIVGRPPGRPWPWSLRWLVPAGLALSITPVWRGSDTLVTLAVLSYLVVVVVIVRSYDAPPVHAWTLTDYAWHGATTVVGSAAEGVRFVASDAVRIESEQVRRLAKPAVGLVVSIPLFLLFLSLFMSADAVFAAYVRRIVNIDIELARLLGRVITSVLLAVVTAGIWRAARVGFPGGPVLDTSRLRAPGASVATALGALVVLFSLFVAVQITYLFGGREALELTGLSHAEYARRGFFEMVAVAILVLGLVTAADWLVGARRSKWVDGFSAVLVVLTLVIVASAAVRMRVYTDEFGLTELRFYTSVFMGWTAVVLIAFLFTVLRGHRARFAFSMFVAGLAAVIGLVAVNPSRIIGEVNVDRHLAGAELDREYPRQLSVDAIPAYAAGAGSVEFPCVLARSLEVAFERDDRSEWGWRSFSIAHRRAADALATLDGCI